MAAHGPAAAQQSGGHAYFTPRFAPGRAPEAASAVLSGRDAERRDSALAFASTWLDDPELLQELETLSEITHATLAVMAIGMDLGHGDERDVYFTAT